MLYEEEISYIHSDRYVTILLEIAIYINVADISRNVERKKRANYRHQDIYGFLSDLRINDCTQSNILQLSLYEK